MPGHPSSSSNPFDWISDGAAAPEDIALHTPAGNWSYGRLAGRAQRLAAGLAGGLGIRPGDRVACLDHNTPDFLATLFACARLGAVMVPLNWRLALPEHDYILENAGASALIAGSAFASQADALRGLRPDLPVLSPEILAERGEDEAIPPAHTADEATPILIVYTSGTTGRPKGAMLSHGALLWNARNSLALHDLTAADHVLTTAPLFHVGGLNIQTLPALHVGARVTLHPRFDPAATLHAIATERPTQTVLVPVQMKAMIDSPVWADTDLSSLRMVVTGSSMVPLPLIEAFHARGVPVVQVYGATETAPIAVCLSHADAVRKIGSTGTPAAHCEARIVDAAGNPLEPGMHGEIVVRGPNVMSGYWRNDTATTEALKDGWFHTGDIGHVDHEGYFYVNDRKKDLIVSGGENVYPAEIELILAECPSVAEAAVVGRAHPHWGEVPIAVVVPNGGGDLDAETVLALFEDRLARYKHPAEVVFIDALPRNAMGKVQKHVLRDMIAARS